MGTTTKLYEEEKDHKPLIRDVTCSQCNYDFKDNFSDKNLCCPECFNTWEEYGFH